MALLCKLAMALRFASATFFAKSGSIPGGTGVGAGAGSGRGGKEAGGGPKPWGFGGASGGRVVGLEVR